MREYASAGCKPPPYGDFASTTLREAAPLRLSACKAGGEGGAHPAAGGQASLAFTHTQSSASFSRSASCWAPT